MRKLGVRVVSAALAACMMASVLPVGAFAAGTGNDDDAGVSAYASGENANGTRVADGDDVTYTLNSGTYTTCIALGGKNVTVNLNGVVDFVPTDSSNGLFRVGGGVEKLTINATGSTVNAGNKNFLTLQFNAADLASLEVNGGTYNVNNGIDIQAITQGNPVAFTGEIKNADITASGIAVSNNRGGKVTVNGGNYTGTANSPVFVVGGADSELDLTGIEVNNQSGTGVRNAGGETGHNSKVTVSNSTFNTKGAAITTGTVKEGSQNRNAETTVTSSSFTAEDKAFLNDGTLTVNEGTTITSTGGELGTVLNSNTLNFNGGTVNAPNGSGIHSVGSSINPVEVTTNINGGTLNAKTNINLQAGTLNVNLSSSVNLSDENTQHDVVLRENQRINIDDNYSGEVSIRVFDPYEEREVTTSNNNRNLNLVSHNSGWVIVYDSNNSCYVLHKSEVTHQLTVEDATAKKYTESGDDESLTEIASPADVAEDDQIFLTANDKTAEGKVFDQWEVTVNGEKLTGADLDNVLTITGEGKATLTMPHGDTTVRATYKDKPNEPTVTPGDDDTTGGSTGGNGGEIGGAIAAVVVGGAAAWGVYEAGTGIYRLMYMPGIILPTTRAELAMLIWEKADKPEPENDVPYDDIDEDNTDLQKAARWMVEQELMDEKDDNKFKPEGHVTKLRVCTTWNEAKEKGLID